MLFFYRLLKTNDVFVLTHESKSPNLLPVHHFYNYILNYDLDFLLTLYCRNKDFFFPFLSLSVSVTVAKNQMSLNRQPHRFISTSLPASLD